jgi:hypothetical protein
MATDSTNFIGNKFGISKAFDYTLKPSAVNGRSYRVSLPASNGSSTGFLPSSTVIFNIPCGMRKNTYIDPTSSYIRYTLQVTGNPTTPATGSGSLVCAGGLNSTGGTQSFTGLGAFMDHDAYSIFNTQTLYSSSNQIENISGANVLYGYMLDTNFGYQNALSNSLNYGMYVPKLDPSEIRRGSFLSVGPNGLSTAAAATISSTDFIKEQNTFCLPLLSGLLGIGATSMVPVYAINDVLRLEILLESAQSALVTIATISGATQYLVLNAVLELTYIELSDLGQSYVLNTTPPNSPIFLVGQSARRNTQTLPSGSSGLFSCLVPSKLASLRSIHCLPRKGADTTAINSYSLSSRINPNFESWYFTISGQNFPQTPVTLVNLGNTGGFAEGLCELNKVFQSLTATDKATLINADNFNVSVATASPSTGVIVGLSDVQSFRNAFAIGLDLQLFHSSTEIITGVNTLNESIYFNASIPSAGSGSGNFNLDFFCLFDALFIVDQTGFISLRC